MAKKNDFHKELNKFLNQTKVGFQKIGQELGSIAKKSEKEIVKISKSGKIQLDIMSLAVQKEKLFYDIGKKVVSLDKKKALDIPELTAYFKKIRTIETDTRKKKREMSGKKRNTK